jgi:hypothetical protein
MIDEQFPGFVITLIIHYASRSAPVFRGVA